MPNDNEERSRFADSFSRLRERVRETVRANRDRSPADTDSAPERATPDRPAQQVDTARPLSQRPETTQEDMEAQKKWMWGEKARLHIERYQKQRWSDFELAHQRQGAARRLAETKALLESSKARAVEANRVDAFLGEAKEIPADKIDNRPGEKLLLRKTRGMARLRPFGDDGPGPSP